MGKCIILRRTLAYFKNLMAATHLKKVQMWDHKLHLHIVEHLSILFCLYLSELRGGWSLSQQP